MQFVLSVIRFHSPILSCHFVLGGDTNSRNYGTVSRLHSSKVKTCTQHQLDGNAMTYMYLSVGFQKMKTIYSVYGDGKRDLRRLSHCYILPVSKATE